MPVTHRPSEPSDYRAIAALMVEALEVPADAVSLDRRLFDWKCWSPHPSTERSRGVLLYQDDKLLAYCGGWPIRLAGEGGAWEATHTIDWVGRADAPGAGLQALKLLTRGCGAVFSVGGSEITQKILPIFGYKPFNRIVLASRPLRWAQPALARGLDWKTPARVARNVWRRLRPGVALSAGWSVRRVEPAEVPEALWPVAGPGEVVSARSAEEIERLLGCPVFEDPGCFLLLRGEKPVAYFALAHTQGRARLLDYGPNGLDEETAYRLGCAAQTLARASAAGSADILAASSEEPALAGWSRAGLTPETVEPIKVWRIAPELKEVERFRLTLMDWDSAYL
ncbi:MAG: hypothetical protein GC160_12310 [Acidobacteria bacterium]|nr:hypothetical protein [Acidobacteriota bacterium]